MKIVLMVAIVSLSLAGCGSMDFFGDSGATQQKSTPAPDAAEHSAMANSAADQTPVMQPAPPSVAQVTASSKAHCTAPAKQRATDAAFQGEDGDTQESVYNRTYSDCVAWDLKHNL